MSLVVRNSCIVEDSSGEYGRADLQGFPIDFLTSHHPETNAQIASTAQALEIVVAL